MPLGLGLVLDASVPRDMCERLGGPDIAPDFTALYEKALVVCRKRKRDQDSERPVVTTRLRIVTDTQNRYTRTSVEGEQRLQLFESFLRKVDELYMRRSLGQREFHRSFTIASLPHIVGQEAWDRHRSFFLERFDEDTYKVFAYTDRPPLPLLITLHTLSHNYARPKCL